MNIKSVNIINLYNLSYCILIRSTWHNVCKLEAALFISCRCKTQTWHGLCSDLALTCILGDRIRSGQQRCVAVHTWHYEYVSSDHFWSDFIDSFCWKKGCHRRVFSVFLCFFFRQFSKVYSHGRPLYLCFWQKYPANPVFIAYRLTSRTIRQSFNV